MKKVLQIVKTVLTAAVVLLAVCMMIFTVVSVNTFDRNDRSLFGYKAFIVLSDSMSATDFSAGDLVLVREVDPTTLVEGDIISYQSTNAENYGETVTHKIRRLTTDSEGKPGFITYGTTTNTDDEAVVTYSFVLGKYQARLPRVGSFFQFLKTTPGYIVCIFLPFLVLILMQGLNSIRLFRQYKAEQLAEVEAKREAERAELEAERARIEEEREQSRKMLEELQQLRMQLTANEQANSESAPAEKTEVESDEDQI